MRRGTRVTEIARVFLKLGFTAFGGPAAHIALFEDEVVTRRGWMSPQDFVDMVGATNLIPGPNSTEMAIMVGLRTGGFAGFIVAGLGFVLPAMLLTGILAWVYVRFGAIPAVESLFFGIKPAVVAIIIAAIMKLREKAIRRFPQAIVAAAVLIAVLLGLYEVFAILAAGVVGILLALLAGKRRGPTLLSPLPLLPGALSAGAALPAFVMRWAETGPTALRLFLVFLKTGLVLFGTGYVLVAYIESDLVSVLGWMTHGQLLDAIAVGQFTPGPVLTAATFVGYLLAGVPGAIAATAGIVVPSFLFVAILNPLIPRMRASRIMASFLDAVNAGALAVMASVVITFAVDFSADWRSIALGVAAVAVRFAFPKIPAFLFILSGAAAGVLITALARVLIG